jgi:BASS family bile acid:Na+ symporter
MDVYARWLTILSRFLHRHFIWFLIGSYLIAGIYPAWGLWMRSIALRDLDLFQEETSITLPMLMLAFLLMNAGLGIDPSQLRQMLRSPLALLTGLAANLLVPLAFIFVVSQTMELWHNPEEMQNILVGLALVASMPIAGSSTAWSQNTNGNLALSLGLVLLSTFLSPVTTPVALHAVGWMAKGSYAGELHALARYRTGSFLILCVLVPSLVGIFLHRLLGEARVAAAKPHLKLLNSLNLLLLSYSNAAVSLPQAITNPDWDFLAVTLAIVVSLCLLAFTSGWLVARSLAVDFGEQVSLMFGLGMNNNGTGLVLASMTLAAHPLVMLPIIFYNLVQHLVAGCVDFFLCRRATFRTT